MDWVGGQTGLWCLGWERGACWCGAGVTASWECALPGAHGLGRTGWAATHLGLAGWANGLERWLGYTGWSAQAGAARGQGPLYRMVGRLSLDGRPSRRPARATEPGLELEPERTAVVVWGGLARDACVAASLWRRTRAYGYIETTGRAAVAQEDGWEVGCAVG